MEIVNPEIKKIKVEYDFLFTSGALLPVTIDPDAGDTIKFEDHAILVHLAPKPSLNDPTVTMIAEDITIFPTQLMCVQKREKEVIEQDPTVKKAWQDEFKRMNGLVN